MARPARLVLALDEGTTGTTALALDRRGSPLGHGYHEITQHYPRPGWVEHDATEIWETTRRSARIALGKAKAEPGDVAALGLTNQRETIVAWDARTGRPLAPAIVWQCRRTADLCRRLRRQGEESGVRRRTGLLLDPYFSGTKIRWLLENDERVRAARKGGTLRFGTVDAWLVWNLTGGRVHATDASNASRTLLFDLSRGRYHPDLLDLFGAREEELPRVVDSSGELGHTDRDVLGAEIPIAGIAGDQQAALFGHACFERGMSKNTYGTGCFALVNAGASVPRPGPGILATAAWRIRGRLTYALEGSVFIGGAVVQWLRDELKIIERSAESEALARAAGAPDDLFLVPGFVGLGAPHWDPYARGLLIGITRGTGRAQVARAALESIAYQSRDIVEALGRSARVRIPLLRVDGGATENDYLMQFQADLLGVPVERSAVPATTAQGAGFLAGLGVDFWRSPQELARRWRPGKRFVPRSTPAWRRDRVARWTQAVRRSLEWARPDASGPR